MFSSSLEIVPVLDQRGRKRFVRFPWHIYHHDPLWVPPLIRSQLHVLDPQRGPFFRYGDAALFMARRGGQDVGRIAGWINHRANQFLGEKAAGFGFFETYNDHEIAAALLDAACNWAREQGMETIRGPFYFSMDDSPGVLIEGFDRSPVLLCGHTPPYYADLLEQYGLIKYRDAYAYAVDLNTFGGDVNNLPPKIVRVAEAVRRRTGVKIRTARMEDWDAEVARVMHLVNVAMGYMRNHVPMDEREFVRFTDELRRVIDPELILFAELDDQPVGFAATIPDVNQALKAVNGRLFPLGWLRMWWHMRHVDVASLKLLAVLEEYRSRGLDSLLYLETARILMQKKYNWVDLSLTAEHNVMVNRLTTNLGGQRYKTYRTYYKDLTSGQTHLDTIRSWTPSRGRLLRRKLL
ncbi:MAG: N-acetyltransferase [Chloroflexi bacterium]|nr:MAG: N-acetyltransferase [Chloroflexota bacterium]